MPSCAQYTSAEEKHWIGKSIKARSNKVLTMYLKALPTFSRPKRVPAKLRKTCRQKYAPCRSVNRKRCRFECYPRSQASGTYDHPDEEPAAPVQADLDMSVLSTLNLVRRGFCMEIIRSASQVHCCYSNRYLQIPVNLVCRAVLLVMPGE